MDSPTLLTFDDFDLLGLKPFAERLEAFLMVEHDYVEGSLVVALNGSFGSGKTTFIEMWKSDLLARGEQEECIPLPVVLNAWESDHAGDPLLAILAGLIGALKLWKGPHSKGKSQLVAAAKDVAWFGGSIANDILAKFTGVNLIKTTELVDSKDPEDEDRPDILALFQKRMDAIANLRTRMTEAFQGDSPKIIVFVDELDRCRPDYAVQYLETIKHVFDVRGMVFVLAVDLSHLENSVKTLYGGELNTAEYFRKFWHRTVPLPKPSGNGQHSLTTHYVQSFFEVEGKRDSGIRLEGRIIGEFAEFATNLSLTPRQAKEAFRMMGFALQTSDEEVKGRLKSHIGTAFMLLCFLKVSRPSSFAEFLNSPGGLGEPLVREIRKVVDQEYAWYWSEFIISGCYNSRSPQDLDSLLVSFGITDLVKTRKEIHDLANTWGYRGGQLWKYAIQIEEAAVFSF